MLKTIHGCLLCSDGRTPYRAFRGATLIFMKPGNGAGCTRRAQREENGAIRLLLWWRCAVSPQPPDAAGESFLLHRPSSLFWFHSVSSLSCLEISSVTLTPMSSPDSSVSAGILTPPPAKHTPPLPPPLPPKAGEACSIPRPRAGSVSVKLQSTDVFDMVPFSTVTPLVPSRASNGCPPPPPTSLPPDMSKDLFGAEPFDPFTCGAADFPPDIQSKLDEMQEGFKMGLTMEGTVFSLDPLDGRC